MTLHFYDICQPAFNLEGKKSYFCFSSSISEYGTKNRVECKNSKIGRKTFFSKQIEYGEFKCLDDSEVLSSDFWGPKISAAAMTTMVLTASMASMTLTASFHQKKY